MSNQPPTLDYRKPLDDANKLRGAAVLGWALFTACMLIASVAVFFFALFALTYTGSLRSDEDLQRAQTVAIILYSLAALGLLALNYLAFRIYRGREHRAIALGIWMGQGIAALVEGACFASLGR